MSTVVTPPPPLAADAALVLRHCARVEGGVPLGSTAAVGEALVWWRAPAADGVPPVAPTAETAYRELLLCLATLRETATVSGLREAVAQTCTAEDVRAFVCGGGGTTAGVAAEVTRWATAATLAYACAALRVRLCVIDYTQPVPEAHWIEAPRCDGGATATACICASSGEDDIACLARLEDGHWSVLAREDDAVHTFTREAELPFALALAYATLGRREHTPVGAPSPGY